MWQRRCPDSCHGVSICEVAVFLKCLHVLCATHARVSHHELPNYVTLLYSWIHEQRPWPCDSDAFSNDQEDSGGSLNHETGRNAVRLHPAAT